MSTTNPSLSADDADLLALAARSRAQLTGPGAPFELQSVDVAGSAMVAYRKAFATLPVLLVTFILMTPLTPRFVRR